MKKILSIIAVAALSLTAKAQTSQTNITSAPAAQTSTVQVAEVAKPASPYYGLLVNTTELQMNSLHNGGGTYDLTNQIFLGRKMNDNLKLYILPQFSTSLNRTNDKDVTFGGSSKMLDTGFGVQVPKALTWANGDGTLNLTARVFAPTAEKNRWTGQQGSLYLRAVTGQQLTKKLNVSHWTIASIANQSQGGYTDPATNKVKRNYNVDLAQFVMASYDIINHVSLQSNIGTEHTWNHAVRSANLDKSVDNVADIEFGVSTDIIPKTNIYLMYKNAPNLSGFSNTQLFADADSEYYLYMFLEI